MPADRRTAMDDVLDRCRHGHAAGDYCPVCDRPEDLDLRDRPVIDVREARDHPKRRRPGN